MNCPTVRTAFVCFVFIESVKQWREVFDDVLELYFHSMYQLAAVEAEPLEAVFHSGMPGAFHYQTDRIDDRPLRRMADVCWQRKDFAFTYGNIVNLAVFRDL